MAIEETKFEKPAPSTAELKITGGNESSVTDASGQATPKNNTSAAAGASSMMAKELPDQGNAEENAAKKPDESNLASKIRQLLATIGFGSKEAENNAEKDLREKGQATGGAPSSQDVANTVRNVTGQEMGDMSKIDPTVLANATKIGQKLLTENGLKTDHPSNHLVAVVSKQQPENGLSA